MTGMVNAARTTRAEVWLGWLLPALDWRDHAPAVLADLRRTAAAGLVLNPEREWNGTEDEDAAALVEWFTSRGVRVWVNSYAIPPLGFPIAGFAVGAEGGQPQTYDRRNEFKPDYLERSFALWRRAGFARTVGAVGLWQNLPGQQNDRHKTAAELARHLAQRPLESVVWGPARWTATACHELARWSGGRTGGGAGLVLGLLVAVALWGSRTA